MSFIFPHHYYVHGVWESKQVLSLPSKPLGSIVHGLCCLPDNVFV